MLHVTMKLDKSEHLFMRRIFLATHHNTRCSSNASIEVTKGEHLNIAEKCNALFCLEWANHLAQL